MRKLRGFSVSSYYNRVKLTLLEKGIPFEEKTVYLSQEESLEKDSLMGKIRFMCTPRGVLTESQVLVEYVDPKYRSIRPMLTPVPSAAN